MDLAKKKIASLIPDNYFSNNFLFLLFISGFIIIAADLGSEMATDKNEIGTVLEILEECTERFVTVDYITNVDRPLLFEIPLTDHQTEETSYSFFVKDRGPPSA